MCEPKKPYFATSYTGFLWLFLLTFGLYQHALAQSKNGFDLGNASIPISEILAGGPPRDGIPALDKPQFTSVAEADWLDDDDLLLAVDIGGEQRAYPTRILVWHEIVNDTVGGQAITVSFCPLCGTGMVFSREVGGKTLDFGVSGLLYQSDVLMYDRQTESLWSQLAMRSVSGPLEDGLVLSTDTGYRRDYNRDPYQGYEEAGRPMFPVPEHRDELPRMSKVLGVIVDGQARAWPLEQLSSTPIQDKLGSQLLSVSYQATQQRPEVRDQQGNKVPHVVVFWFAWQAFYPESGLWRGTQP